MQVLALRVDENVAASEVAFRINCHLPPGVGIALAKDAPRKFHPQWKSTGKEYRYRITSDENSSWANAAWGTVVDAVALRQTLALVVGTRNFAAFHENGSAVKPRTIQAAEVVALTPSIIEVRMRGDGFGKYMVRYLVGSAVGVATGVIDASAFQAGLESAQPFKGIKAPAQGLILWDVCYSAPDDPFTVAEREAAANVPPSPPYGTA
jgi:tRNA pseudouridine38-40 synthase